MARELSADCFDDRCRDCTWAGCQDHCHEDQEFDWLNGWVDDDDEDAHAQIIDE